MILGKETSDWPLQDARPDLAATWFDHLRVQTREVVAAMEATVYSGVDSKLSVQEVAEAVDRHRHQASFNRALASGMLAKRSKLGLTLTSAAEASIREAIEDIERLVDQVHKTAFFFEAVEKDATVYKSFVK